MLRTSLFASSLMCIACAAPPSEPPPVCEVEVEGCDGCGGLGCACFGDDSCTEGVCSEVNTCILVEEGMVYVPPGPFWMGCREGVDTDELTGPCPTYQLPYRQVTLDGFWIDQTEVQKGAYRLCMEAGVCDEPGSWDVEHKEGPPLSGATPGPGTEDFPVAGLRWSEAETYCRWIGKRLPTEAEWEKSSRGTDGRKYTWGNSNPGCKYGNYGTTFGDCDYDVDFRILTPTGMFPAGMSPYGALDMVGNVSEWTSDGYEGSGSSGSGYEGLPATNPTGFDSDSNRILRGSSYQYAVLAKGGYILRSSFRAFGKMSWTLLPPEPGVRCATTNIVP